MVPSNGSKTKIDVAVLQEKIRQIKDNDLVHLAAQVEEVDRKVVSFGEKFEHRMDSTDLKIMKIMTIGGLLLVAVEIAIGAYFKQ